MLVVTFAFVVLRLSGDPALMILGPDAPPEALAAFRKAWGLDQPIWLQYLDYFGAIAQGELGRPCATAARRSQLVAGAHSGHAGADVPALAAEDRRSAFPPASTPRCIAIR